MIYMTITAVIAFVCGVWFGFLITSLLVAAKRNRSIDRLEGSD